MKNQSLKLMIALLFLVCIALLSSCADVVIEIPATNIKTEITGDLSDFRNYEVGDTIYVLSSNHIYPRKYRIDHNPFFKDTTIVTNAGTLLFYNKAIILKN